MSTFLDITQGVATGRTGKIMSGGQMVDACSSGVPITTIINPGSSYSLRFPNWGDIGYRILPNANFSIELSGGNTGELQKITIIIQQPITGNCEAVWPENIQWDEKPFVDSRIGYVSIFEIIWDGLGNYYGRMIYG
ncbi:hypothetical protein [Acetobacter persici]|uniref:hypothetical protein n=1 Tax=Acetobacter persici TaxID=1076596 RepID=UPI001BAB6908|nr:hypothetical protein [Acetobacter persici]MBS1017260.1 hypothetical protein [Acetobacter persici]